MKILFKAINDSFPTLEIEIEESDSLLSINQKIKEALGYEVLLLPLLLEGKNCRTLKEYNQIIQKINPKFHFNIIDKRTLSPWENDILSSVAILGKDHSVPPFDFNRTINLFTHLPREIVESFIVRFGDIADMFGLTVRDTLSKQLGRRTLQIHPYPWIKAGASAIIVYKDIFDTVYTALVYNKRTDRRPEADPQRLAGIPSEWKVSEGYLNPKPCKSYSPLEASGINDDAEERLLTGMGMEQAYANASSATFNHVGELMNECVQREVREEIHLSCLPSHVHLAYQLEHPKRPMLTNIYLLDLGIHLSPPELLIDGIEIGEAVWAKLSAFRFEKQENQFRVLFDYYDEEGNTYPVEVSPTYALIIGYGILKYRELEIQNTSPLFGGRENVEAKIKRILVLPMLNSEEKSLEDVMGMTIPEKLLANCVIPGNHLEKTKNLCALAALGHHAAAYHKKILLLAKLFQNTPENEFLQAQQLLRIVDQGLFIAENLLRNKCRFFSRRVNCSASLGQYENIIFDVGNVLLLCDHVYVISKAFGNTDQLSYYKKEVFSSYEWVVEWDQGKITMEELVVKLSQRLNLHPKALRRVITITIDSLVPMEESMDLLYRLDQLGVNLFALTNMAKEAYEVITAKYKFWSKFKHVTVSSKIGLVKPQKEIFEYLIKKNCLNPKRSVFIDDNKDNLPPAQELKISTVHFQNAKQCANELAMISGLGRLPIPFASCKMK